MTSFPNCTTIDNYAFNKCTSLRFLYIPACTSIGSYVFQSCYRLVELYVGIGQSVVPTLGSFAFLSTPIGGYSTVAGQYGSVYVPASLYNSFLTAQNWSSIASRIVGV